MGSKQTDLLIIGPAKILMQGEGGGGRTVDGTTSTELLESMCRYCCPFAAILSCA